MNELLKLLETATAAGQSFSELDIAMLDEIASTSKDKELLEFMSNLKFLGNGISTTRINDSAKIRFFQIVISECTSHIEANKLFEVMSFNAKKSIFLTDNYQRELTKFKEKIKQ